MVLVHLTTYQLIKDTCCHCYACCALRFTRGGDCTILQGVSSLSLDSSHTEEDRGGNPLYVKGTHGAPAVPDGDKKEEDALEVFVDMDKETTPDEGPNDKKNRAEAETTDTTVRMPNPAQYMDAEAFAAEQSQLRQENSKGNDGRKTLMVSHW